MNVLKRSIAALTSVFVVLGMMMVPVTVSADDTIDQENQDTGYRSRNRNRHRIRRNHRTNRTNRASARNHSRIETETGRNEQNMNTDSGDQESGEIDIVGTIDNVLNENVVDEDDDDYEPLEVDIDQRNDDTGSRSRNTNDVRVRDRRSVRVRNVARASNRVNIDASTGRNEQNKNTKSGEQNSGDVKVDLSFGNYLN